MIDTHAHLNLKAFQKDYQEVISRSFDHGVTAIINVGVNFETSKRACEIAREFESASWRKEIKIFSTIGLHPSEINQEIFQPKKYLELAKKYPSVIKAVGETGLDYSRPVRNSEGSQREISNGVHLKNEEDRKKQKQISREHLQLARELNLPLVLHCRGEAQATEKPYFEILEILDNFKEITGVIHSFAVSWEVAEKFLDLGFYFGLNGIITFPNFQYREMVKKMPLQKILLETDCPYLAPQAVRGTRNEPKNLFYIASEIAKIKGEPLTKIIKATDQNAQKFFNL